RQPQHFIYTCLTKACSLNAWWHFRQCHFTHDFLLFCYYSQSSAPRFTSYTKPRTTILKKIPIFHRPSTPISLKLTAQGYINITSTSNTTNKIAAIKYLTEKGCLALPMTSTPDSNAPNLFSVRTFGPIKCVPIIVNTPNATATPNCMRMGI